jgi:hypothetical protein
MSKELMRAYTTRDATGVGYEPNDDTNYIFAIPCSVDNTFQQGQTSQSIVADTMDTLVWYGRGSNGALYFEMTQVIIQVYIRIRLVFPKLVSYSK